MESAEEELVAWLDAQESVVFDPVSIPWIGLRIGQVAGRAAKHVGPGVAIDWFEIEGPINPSWPPESHKRLSVTCRSNHYPKRPDNPPRREAVRGIGGYLPHFYTDIPPSERKPPLENCPIGAAGRRCEKNPGDFLARAFVATFAIKSLNRIFDYFGQD